MLAQLGCQEQQLCFKRINKKHTVILLSDKYNKLNASNLINIKNKKKRNGLCLFNFQTHHQYWFLQNLN